MQLAAASNQRAVNGRLPDQYTKRSESISEPQLKSHDCILLVHVTLLTVRGLYHPILMSSLHPCCLLVMLIL